ncbi:hypothetical protein DQM28_12190 [Leptospira mayottensis]|uniref:DUF1564 family protein n=1 Tax=Leptospira mayottensis TaxID=1137606 RepID=A0ABM6YDF5_9LEPT|nr:hypothetical protein DQM28_12190 [Leptospira mayottensis]
MTNRKARDFSRAFFRTDFEKNRRKYDKDLKLRFYFTKVEISDIRNFFKTSHSKTKVLLPPMFLLLGPSAIFSKVHLVSLSHICPFHFYIITLSEYKSFLRQALIWRPQSEL